MARSAGVEAHESASFGALLREYRLAAGLSQEALAERARLSIDAIGALERGVRQVPQRATLALLIEALGIRGAERQRLEAAAVREPRPRHRAPAAVPRGNLARPLTSFVGRARELAALAELLQSRRLVTVTGPGGVGKTRLALEVARAVQERYDDGVWWVDLAPLDAGAAIAHEIAAALRLGGGRHGDALADLTAALRDRTLLIALDNCEHVLTDVARTVGALLERCPKMHVLATSRERLRIDGEHLFPLLPLPAAGEDEIVGAGDVLAYEATRLFVERAAAADPEFAVSDENAAAIATIVRRVDGLPFTIELAAAGVALMSPAEIVRRLHEPFSLLAEGPRTATPRHRTLHALIDWSYALLSPPERTLLRRLAVFPGTWDVDACVAVASEALDGNVVAALLSLVAKSLVVRDRHEGDERFRLLVTVRDYATERLIDEDDPDAAERALAQHVLAIVRRAAAVPSSRRTGAWLDSLARDFDTIRGALRWSLAEGHAVPLGAEIAVALAYFWQARRPRDGAQWLALAMERGAALAETLRARVFVELAGIRPDAPHTVDVVRQAIEAFRRLGDRSGLCAALSRLGQALINVGRFAEAETALEECLALAHDAGDDPSTTRSTALFAAAQLYLGKRESAKTLFERARSLAARSDDAAGLGLASYGLAETAIAESDATSALRHAAAALEAFASLGDHRNGAWSRSLLAHALLIAERGDDALGEAVEAMRQLADAQFSLPFVEASIAAASALAARGDVRAAALCLAHADGMASALAPFVPGPSWLALRESTGRRLGECVDAAERERFHAAGSRGESALVLALLSRR